jgi:prevent-host-death family protein
MEEPMISATFTQFRNNAASYFDKVEKGETIEIYRNGKPSAIMLPAAGKASATGHWKNRKPLFDLGGDIASRLLADMRKKGR